MEMVEPAGSATVALLFLFFLALVVEMQNKKGRTKPEKIHGTIAMTKIIASTFFIAFAGVGYMLKKAEYMFLVETAVSWALLWATLGTVQRIIRHLDHE